MFEGVLPRHVDNAFGGQKLAVWLFALILLVRIAQSVSVLFGGASVVSGADGIPLDSYTPPAAQTVVSLWALLGLTRLLIYLLCLIVVIRYRSIMPFMFGLLLVQDVGRSLVLHFWPIVRVGTPPGPIVNLALTVLTIIGFVLSLLPRRNPPAQST
jgi:hypothetical protein